jgi:hypothetical protein
MEVAKTVVNDSAARKITGISGRCVRCEFEAGCYPILAGTGAAVFPLSVGPFLSLRPPVRCSLQRKQVSGPMDV